MFKKAILPLAAVTALSAFAVPAAAQTISVSFQSYSQGYDRGYERGWDRGWERIGRRLDRLDRQIDQGIRSGQLNRREAAHLRSQFHALVELERRYSRNGLSEWERRDLNARFDRLEREVHYARRDRDRRRW